MTTTALGAMPAASAAPEMDLVGQTMVITGATSGIGRAALRALAQRGAYVIGVGRSVERCHAVEVELLQATPDARLSFVIADLASQDQVRRAAEEIGEILDAQGQGLDILINNAGTVSSWRQTTEDGYELQFAVNHLAPFLLTHDLMPWLARSPAEDHAAARVITVSSGSHYGARIHWRDVMFRVGYTTLAAYKQSKLANVLFTAELNRRLGSGAPIRAYAADPGLVNTRIGSKGTGGWVQWFWNLRRRGGVSPEAGAATIVFLASDPGAAAAATESLYWKACKPKRPSRRARREQDAARLWALSERLCGISWL